MRRQMVTTLYNNYDNSLSRTESLGVYNKRIQEPITRSVQLPHIPVTAFPQTDLFLV